MDGEELTEQETALYDRQIRVWGADAQRRLSKSHVLVCGMKGTVAEFCKNIVLAGVGSLTLVDDRPVTEEVLAANFLIPPEEDIYGGKSLAEACCDSLKEFNPMVHVLVEKGDLSSFGGDFFQKFDVVVVSCCPLSTKKLINEKCWKLSKRVAFYTVDCRDSCGEIFVDLQEYKCTRMKGAETSECELKYPSFQCLNLPCGLSQSTLFCNRIEHQNCFYYKEVNSMDNLDSNVIEEFEEAEGRKPGEICFEDLPAVLKLKKEICEQQSLSESHIPNALVERLVMGTREFPPVCATIGRILGQEVIQVMSGKRVPLKNFFFFDAMDGQGIIEDISSTHSQKNAAYLGTVVEL